MLVLTRRLNEAIIVDGPAKFVILEIKDTRVKVGVIAESSTDIVRGELVPREEYDGEDTRL